MQRTKQPKPERVQVGALVNRRLWQQLKAQALLQDRLAAQLLDDAIALYLKSENVSGLMGVKQKG